MHLVVVTNWYPDGRPNSEYAPHLLEGLRLARPDRRITVLAGAPGGLSNAGREATASHLPQMSALRVERAWRHGHLNVAGDVVAAVRRLRPDAVLFNASFNAWGGNVANLSAFWGMRRVAREVRTIVLLHYLPQTLTGAVRYRLAPWHWAGIDLACRFVSRAQVVAFTLARDVACFTARYGGTDVVQVEHGLLGAPSMPVVEVPDEVPTVLAFGYWGPGKDLDLLLRAVEAVPSVRLIVAGVSHPRFPGHLEAIRARGVSSRVSFTGYVDDADLPALFGRARAVVLPYASDSGTSGVLHLAAQHGRAIIASNLPVLRDETARLGLAVRFFSGVDELRQQLVDLSDAETLRVEGNHNLEAVRPLSRQAVGERWWTIIEGAREAPRPHC